MKKTLLILGIYLLSIVIHEITHLIQILTIENITYEGYGFGKSLLLGGNHLFWWEVDYPGPILPTLNYYEIQAYGIQTLFLIGICLKNRFKFGGVQKCVSC